MTKSEHRLAEGMLWLTAEPPKVTLAGVDTEDEHGPGGHSAEAICQKFDAQAERIKALEAEHAKQLSIVRDDYPLLCGRLAKANAVILQAKIALEEAVAYSTIYIKIFPANQRTALAAIEAYQTGEES